MSKRVYISCDYDEDSSDFDVVKALNKWNNDNRYNIDFVDMSKVASGSVSNNDDCRICDLKEEFNRQINASSAVIFVVGSKTRFRTAGSECERATKNWWDCYCTPYKENTNGKKQCKCFQTSSDCNGNCGNINSYSYLRHEFEQSIAKTKKIIIVYNSLRLEKSWLPSYMKNYEYKAKPFWVCNNYGNKVGNYEFIKEELRF